MKHPVRIGKYEIEQFLGGGMSHVYRARDTVLGREVAVKVLTDAAASDPEAKARFLREARTASSVSHENIIAVFDFGEDHGRPFMVMEYLEGESLRQALVNGHAGDFRRRMEIALDVARAIDCVHSKKIVHRDIKPENIHIDKTGRARLMDFGIAKSQGMTLTKSGFTLGTPYYMAPEQVVGEAVSEKADVYSFGVLLYELLTGMKPVTGDSFEKVFHRILHDPVPIEPLHKAHVPHAVGQLVLRCLSKLPATRPESAEEVCLEIERAIPPLPRPPAAAVPPVRVKETPPAPKPPPARAPVPVAAQAPSSELPAPLRYLPPPLRTDVGLMFLGASGVIAVVGVALWILKLAHVAF